MLGRFELQTILLLNKELITHVFIGLEALLF